MRGTRGGRGPAEARRRQRAREEDLMSSAVAAAAVGRGDLMPVGRRHKINSKLGNLYMLCPEDLRLATKNILRM